MPLTPAPVSHLPGAGGDRLHDLESAYLDTILRLLQLARSRHPTAGTHLGRISHLAAELASRQGLPGHQVQLIHSAAALHDIGKIAIADAILNKPGPLDDHEWEIVRQHPAVGADLLHGSLSPLLGCAQLVALSHHERWDGSGYPHGLRGEAIPLPARIVMLCDQYDALRSARPYKVAYDHETACAILFSGDDRTRPEHFDPKLLELFRRIHRRFEVLWSQLEHRCPLPIS